MGNPDVLWFPLRETQGFSGLFHKTLNILGMRVESTAASDLDCAVTRSKIFKQRNLPLLSVRPFTVRLRSLRFR